MNLTGLIVNILLFLCVVAVPFLRYYNSKYLIIKDWQYILIFSTFYLFNKFHLLFHNYPLNEDEAMNIADGMVLLKIDPVLWRSVDFFTLGPVHILHFILPGLLGFENDYVNVRFIWLVINLISFIFVYKSCDVAFGNRIKGIAFIYPFLFFAFGNIINLNHFTNESTSVLLMSAGVFLLLKRIQDKTYRPLLDILFYFHMGLIPYCKLQSVPIALVMSFIYLVYGIKNSAGNKFVYFLKACLGGTLPSILLAIYLIFYGQLNNFINFYIVSNFNYGSDDSIFGNIFLTFIVRGISEFPINYFLKHLYFLVFLILLIVVVKNRFKDMLINAVVLLFAATIYSISKTGYTYGHYFAYLLVTLPLGLGILIKETETLIARPVFSRTLILSVVLLLSTAIFYINSKMYWLNNTYEEAFISAGKKREPIPLSESARELISLRGKLRREPRMVIFDWWPRLHVSTGITQATHQNVPERLFGFQSSEKEATNFAKKIFLEDIIKNKPEFFLVASTTQRAYFDFRYSSFNRIPEIKSYFDSNYIFYKHLDDMDIYVRKDLKKVLL